MPFVVRAFPIVRPVAELKAFLDQLKGPKRAETAQFKAEVCRMSGVDPNVTPLGPPTQEMFRWP